MLASIIPSLWPEEFKVDVQTPYVILKVQAELLGKVTRGILEGVVETEANKDRVQHRLVVIAPAYNGYRHTLVVAIHHPDLPYPTEIRSEGLATIEHPARTVGTPAVVLPEKITYPKAHSDEQMIELVKQALQSQATRALILSLIAKSNEGRPRTQDANSGVSE